MNLMNDLSDIVKTSNKRKLTIVATNDFLNQYNILSDELKDKAIAVLSVLQAAKYPEDYGFNTLYEMEQYRQDHKIVDIQEVLESNEWKI